ncbi:hypothetical protein PR048_019074 [Dryococelus australis]|uniref:J domain-containing protein n=1 Tax=Dryococelus australis TaxID=614101 RepID=A0ABQ9H2U6_9NEOP|nr:hypothetical protein PR048_019074 [Dryococelus australis]
MYEQTRHLNAPMEDEELAEVILAQMPSCYQDRWSDRTFTNLNDFRYIVLRIDQSEHQKSTGNRDPDRQAIVRPPPLYPTQHDRNFNPHHASPGSENPRVGYLSYSENTGEDQAFVMYQEARIKRIIRQVPGEGSNFRQDTVGRKVIGRDRYEASVPQPQPNTYVHHDGTVYALPSNNRSEAPVRPKPRQDEGKDADASEIRRAYRRLSLVLHPDKNDAPDAEVKFRELVAVYDVLRDNNKRMRYNDVLKNGLPDWRQAVYYYRRVRKMGLAEMLVILSILLTIGQYGVAWASYVEKKYNAEQYLNLKLKRLQKKVKKGKYDGPPLPETIELDIPSPSVWNTLPFQLPRFLWFCITMCPNRFRLLCQYLAERKQKKEEETSSEEEVEVEVRPVRRRKGKFAPPEVKTAAADPASSPVDLSRQEQLVEESVEEPPPVVSGGLWTDDDIVELIRLVKKYPQGISGRWEKIAAAMNRPVGEVTHIAKKVKEDGYRVGRPEEVAEEQPEEPLKVKTKGGKLGTMASEEDTWSQQQQKALEIALVKFPKGGALDRWEKIAKCVPGKSRVSSLPT